MKVTVFGASGKVGRLVVERLLQDGHTVTVFVHSSNRYADNNDLKVIQGDIHNAAQVEKALDGAEVVISTLGSWHTKTKDIVSSAMRLAIPIMQQQGIQRLITLTGSAATAPGQQLSSSEKIAHKVFNLVAKNIIKDAETHLQLLNGSGLDWTCLRASIMKNGAAAGYILNQSGPTAIETINRAAVAKALVDQINDRNFISQAPHIHGA